MNHYMPACVSASRRQFLGRIGRWGLASAATTAGIGTGLSLVPEVSAFAEQLHDFIEGPSEADVPRLLLGWPCRCCTTSMPGQACTSPTSSWSTVSGAGWLVGWLVVVPWLALAGKQQHTAWHGAAAACLLAA